MILEQLFEKYVYLFDGILCSKCVYNTFHMIQYVL